MPAIISDSSLSPGIINQDQSLFDYPDTPQPSILNFQASATQPLPGGTAVATNLLSPDLVLAQRLVNFPSEVFDLSPGSAIIHFMQAMLGDSGVGQLRKRQLLARLQGAVTSTNFYDLDSFYGALFGALRGPDGSLPANPATGTTVSPYSDLASPDAWDDIYSIDATFRERIIALASAIAMGGTVPGLQAVAEALTGVPCSVIEVWKLIDSQGSQTAPSVLWSQLQAQYHNWGQLGGSGQTWQQVEGILIYGGMGINARNEVMIQPRTQYGTDVASLRQQAADQFGVLRVEEVLKPAFSLVSVNYAPALVNIPTSIHSVWADSDYWEIVTHVTPASAQDPAYAPALASYQSGGTLAGATFAQPVPPFSQSQGTQYSYVSDVTTAWAQAGPLDNPTDLRDFETVAFPSGPDIQYLPAKAVMQPDKAASARTASAVAVKAAPYSGPRVMVPGTS
jgi:hypothetical protein